MAAFAAYREQLRDTLGTDPSAEVAAFHVELLAGTAPLRPTSAPPRPDAPAMSNARVHGLRVAP